MAGESPLKRSLAAGNVPLGLFIGIPSPALVELAAASGYDFVIIDAEHGAIGVESAEHMIRAAQAFGIEPIVRVPQNERGVIQPYLDAGAGGIQVPMIGTRADAERAVALARYAPAGSRGLAGNRGARYGQIGQRYTAESNERTMVILQIETAQAVPEAAAIASVDGVDAVFIGPSDLSQSLGRAGDYAAPEVQDAIAQIAGKARGIRPCGILARTGAEARELAGQGFSFIETAVVPHLLRGLAGFVAEARPQQS